MLNYTEHLLACLAEEAGEVAQAAGKCLRFMDCETGTVLLRNDQGGDDAMVCLTKEIQDLLAVVDLLSEIGFPLGDVYAELPKMAKQRKLQNYYRVINEGVGE